VRRSPDRDRYDGARQRRARTLYQSWKIPDARQFKDWLIRSRSMTKPKISQAELAAQCGLHRRTISSIEQGTREPSLEIAAMIWRVLHAAYQGRLWVAIQVRRDNRALAGRPSSEHMGRLDTDSAPVKLRRLKPDPVSKSR